MPKESLKDKLDGNQLDLSMIQLDVVPVKEIAAIPKATKIDMSCNILTSIPPEICTLTNIVELDLSKNKIKCLPEDFGALLRLQRLDLYQNQLVHVPVSFCHLKNLKWLDLKNNPLDEHIKSAAGECLNDSQCRNCAKNVVAFMKRVQSDQERKRQKRLQEERERAAAEKAEEDLLRERKRAERKAEKEKRRREYEAALTEKKLREKLTVSHSGDTQKSTNGTSKDVNVQSKEKAGFGCCGVFLGFLFGLIAVFIGLYFYCDSHPTDMACKQGNQVIKQYVKQARAYVDTFIK